MRKTREEKAITLIALIITIVVLLILAVVAINAVTGDGIIQHAVNAKEDYEKAQAKENGILAYYEQYLNTQSGSGPWKQDGDSVYMIDSEGKRINLKIGDKVEYDEGYDAENLKTTTLDSEFKMDNLDWRVLGINKNGQLELISTQPTNSTFTLSGEDGYLNGTAKLNKICSDLYSTEIATARSLNVEDIDKLAGIKTEEDIRALPGVTDYGSWYKYEWNSGYIQYSKSTDYNPGTNPGTWSTLEDTNNTKFKEPGKKEINSSNTTDIAKIKYTGYSYSVPSKVTFSTSDGILISDLITNGLNEENNEKDNTIKIQWIASTFCACNQQYADSAVNFYLYYLTDRARLSGALMWGSNGESGGNGYSLRPVVTLKSGVQIEYKDGNWKLNEK